MAAQKTGTVVDVRRAMNGGSERVWILVRETETNAIKSMAGDPYMYTDLQFAAKGQKVNFEYGDTAGFYSFAIVWAESPRPWEDNAGAPQR